MPIEIIQKGQRKTVKIDKAEVAKREKVIRIGVQVHPVQEELALHLGLLSGGKRGLFISSVAANSPAGKAGLQDGDILIKANGKWLRSRDILNNLVRESQGKEISLEFLRAGKEREVKVVAEELPERQNFLVPLRRIIDVRGFGVDHVQLRDSVDSAMLERILTAIDQLTKEISEVRAELKGKKNE